MNYFLKCPQKLSFFPPNDQFSRIRTITTEKEKEIIAPPASFPFALFLIIFINAVLVFVIPDNSAAIIPVIAGSRRIILFFEEAFMNFGFYIYFDSGGVIINCPSMVVIS